MNAVAQAPLLSSMLGQVAMVIKLKSSSLGLNRLDREASKQSDDNHNALRGTGKTYVSRLAGAEHQVKAIAAQAAAAGKRLAELTTDYNGERLIANNLLVKWQQDWATLKGEH